VKEEKRARVIEKERERKRKGMSSEWVERRKSRRGRRERDRLEWKRERGERD